MTTIDQSWRGVATEDNELGWRMALDRLAALVERDA